MRARFKKESFFSVPKQELFAFHERDDAFSLLTPASENIEVGSTASTLAPSDEVVRFAVRFGPLRLRFENVHTVYEPFDLFVDEQRRGLFTEWRHEHRFEQAGWDGDPASMLSDEIVYSHPLLPLLNPFVRHRLRRLFEYRHRATAREVHSGRSKENRRARRGRRHHRSHRPDREANRADSRRRGLACDRARAKRGEGPETARRSGELRPLGFHRARPRRLEALPLRGGRRDTPGGNPSVQDSAGQTAFKREMEQSRTLGTRQLVDAIIASQRKPRVFISASALGYYGTDPDGVVDETASPADDLLARICVNWENEARRLDAHGVRTVQMRIGIVLSTESGALKELPAPVPDGDGWNDGRSASPHQLGAHRGHGAHVRDGAEE